MGYNKYQKNYKRYDNNDYAERHGLIKREDSPSIAREVGGKVKQNIQNKWQRFKERNTPERRRERITNYNLQAAEIKAKTGVVKAKYEKRKYSALNAFGAGGMGNVTKARQHKPAKVRGTQMGTQMGMTDIGSSGQGMNEMFGVGTPQYSQSRKYKKQYMQPQSDGLRDMFGM